MIHGSRASGAARPLSWSPPGPCLVCRSELAIHAPVNAAGPAMPAAAPSRDAAPPLAVDHDTILRRLVHQLGARDHTEPEALR
jgi:hypothetical protein